MAKLPRKALEKIQKDGLDLAEQKHNDYSSAVDAIEVQGVIGIVVRIFDKACRLLSLVVHNKDQKVKDESIRDTLKDIINYATYGVCLLDNNCKDEDPKEKK